MKTISFFVPGLAQPGGSKRAFYVEKLGRAVVTDANAKAKPWKNQVACFANQAYQGDPLTGPIQLRITFYMTRPKGHFGTGRNKGILKNSAPSRHTTKPDATKLTRAAEDALTGLLWVDDAQITDQLIFKRYGDRPGAQITVTQLSEGNHEGNNHGAKNLSQKTEQGMDGNHLLFRAEHSPATIG